MPLPSYTRLHPDARLSPRQRKFLSDWAGQEYERLSKEPQPAR